VERSRPRLRLAFFARVAQALLPVRFFVDGRSLRRKKKTAQRCLHFFPSLRQENKRSVEGDLNLVP
jgi:hypothetical protein